MLGYNLTSYFKGKDINDVAVINTVGDCITNFNVCLLNVVFSMDLHISNSIAILYFFNFVEIIRENFQFLREPHQFLWR